MSVSSTVRKASKRMLTEYVAQGEPKYWACPRCNHRNKLNKLRCDSSNCGGLGTRLDSTDSPELYRAAKRELERRNAKSETAQGEVT